MKQKAVVSESGRTFTTHYPAFKLLGLDTEGWQKELKQLPVIPNGTEVTITNEITYPQYGINVQICLIEDIYGVQSVINKEGLTLL